MVGTARHQDAGTALEAEIEKREWSEALLKSQIRILEKVALNPPLIDILDAIMGECGTRFPEMIGSILLLDPDGLHVRHGSGPGLPPEYIRAIDGVAIGPRAGSCGTAAYLGRPVIVEDIATDPLWEDYRHIALPHGLRACWSTPVFDARGKVMGTFALYGREPGGPSERQLRLIGTLTHLTAIAISRDRAETALRVSESRYRRLVDSNIMPVMIGDIRGAITEANDRFLDMIGYTREDLLAGRVNWVALTPPGWEAVDAEALRELAAKGVTAPWEKEYIGKDGRRIPIRARVATLDGLPDVGICLIEDLTLSKRAETERLQMYNRISDGFAALDERWRYVFANAKAGQILGRSPESLIGTHIWTEFPPGAEGKFRATCEMAMAEQKPMVSEDFYPPNQRWFENHIYPSPQGLSIYFHDITKRKESELKIREQLEELLRWQQVTLGREGRVQELKDEVNGLLAERGLPARYRSQEHR